MLTKVFIQQILSTEIEVDIPEQVNQKELESFIKKNVITPDYAMSYYDKKVSKIPMYENWILDNEVIMKIDSMPKNSSRSDYNYSEEDGYND